MEFGGDSTHDLKGQVCRVQTGLDSKVIGQSHVECC